MSIDPREATRLTDLFAEIEDAVSSIQGALRHRQQPQDFHFHKALKATRDGHDAIRALLSVPSPSTDWPKVLQRYGMIHERISTYEDGDESPALLKLCALRDGLLQAARSEDASRITTALEATNILPGRSPSPSPDVRGDGEKNNSSAAGAAPFDPWLIVTFCLKYDGGECLGDHPLMMARALAGVVSALGIKTERHYENEWTATTKDYDGPGSPMGTGNTETEAISDLIDRLDTK